MQDKQGTSWECRADLTLEGCRKGGATSELLGDKVSRFFGSDLIAALRPVPGSRNDCSARQGSKAGMRWRPVESKASPCAARVATLRLAGAGAGVARADFTRRGVWAVVGSGRCARWIQALALSAWCLAGCMPGEGQLSCACRCGALGVVALLTLSVVFQAVFASTCCLPRSFDASQYWRAISNSLLISPPHDTFPLSLLSNDLFMLFVSHRSTSLFYLHWEQGCILGY